MVPEAKLLLDAITGNIGALTNGATGTSANIDRLDADFVSIDVAATTQFSSTQAGSPSVLKIQQSDTTVASTFTDVVGFRGASATATNVDFVVPIGRTAGSNAYKFNVDARALKRYLNVVVSPVCSTITTNPTTQTFCVSANGFQMKQSPSTAAKANVLALIEG
jgi:hypothetical protein